MLKPVGADIAQQIAESAARGIETPDDLYDMVLLQSRLLGALYGSVDTLAHEVYGNGTPGGLKLTINTMERRLCDISQRIDKIAAVKPNDTTFDRAIRWMADKVLPSILTTSILFVFGLTFFGAVMLMAWRAGVFDLVILGGAR